MLPPSVYKKKSLSPPAVRLPVCVCVCVVVWYSTGGNGVLRCGSLTVCVYMFLCSIICLFVLPRGV